jgi:hypothetical protein
VRGALAVAVALLSVAGLAGEAPMESPPGAIAIQGDALAIPFSDAEWTNMNASGAPAEGLRNMAMVYDSDADRTIVFGGHFYEGGVDYGSNRTLAYDFESNAWTDLAPAVHPPGGWTHRAAYDSWAKRTIMFGGYDIERLTYSEDTWAFDFRLNEWTNRSPALHPSARSRQGMAFDAASNRVILFGGHTIENQYSDETWAYGFAWNAWANVTSDVRPPGRRSPGMAYDSDSDRVILFGGVDFANQKGELNDTWSYDFETNTWTEMSPPTAPSKRYSFGFAYDSGIDRCILFGGVGGGNVTWAYDYDNNTWSVLNASNAPRTHLLQGVAYDTQSARTIMFGGEGGGGNDTWALRTQSGPPLAPQDLSAVGGNGQVSLSWDAPPSNGGSPITGYRVYRGLDVGNLTVIADVGDVRSFVDQNVTNGVTYIYRVSALNAIGEGSPSLPADATPDGEPPVTVASLSGCDGQAGWYTCPVVIVDLQASDGISGVARTSYQIDGMGWQTYEGPFPVADDGVHAVDFFSVDEAGNAETVRRMSVSIDATSPQTLVMTEGASGQHGWFLSPVLVSLHGDDSASGVSGIQVGVDGGAPFLYSNPFSLGEGVHRVDYSATDGAGNVESTQTTTVRIDTTPPESAAWVSGPLGDHGWYRSSVEVTLYSNDALSGVATLEYRVDDGPWTPYASPFSVGEGVHTIGFAAKDVAGGSEPAQTFVIRVDSTSPTLGTIRPSGPLSTSHVDFVWSATDDGSGVERYDVSVDGGAWITVGTDPRIALRLSDGAHSIVVRAADAAGHTAQGSVSVTVDTNVFSLGGPYGALPTMGILALVVVFTAILAALRRRRRR